MWEIFQLIQDSALATSLRASRWVYPLVNAAHIAGLALLFGAIVPMDLRLAGAWRSRVSVQGLARVLLPVAISGLVLTLITGALLFSVAAVRYAEMGLFQLKMALLLAALVNALLLNRAARSWVEEDQRAEPLSFKLASVLSIAIWTAIILCGRLIAYF